MTTNKFIEINNAGKKNTGNGNTGDCNVGNYNAGNGNTGDCNTGYWNTGYCNTGHWNTGDFNTGDYNKTDRSSGVFCTEQPKLIMFNKETNMTFEEWQDTEAYDLLCQVPKNIWIRFEKMTEEEKQKFPSAKTCGGYLKELSRKEAWTRWWSNLNNHDKQEIFNLPNFNLKIFNEIMELEISKEEYDGLI